MKKTWETFHVGSSFFFLDWENDSLSTSKQSKSKSSIMSDPCFSTPLTMELTSETYEILDPVNSGVRNSWGSFDI